MNTGTFVLNNMNSEMRLDYSVINDAVNLSARLDHKLEITKTKWVKVTPLLYPSFTQEKLKNIKSIEVDKIKVMSI